MIKIIPRPTVKAPLWQNTLFYFAVILLIGSIASYFVLDNFQKKASENLQGVENVLAEKKLTGKIKLLEKEILGYKKKIKDFPQVADSHFLTSKIFKFIESLTHPKVMWSNFDLNTAESTIVLSGLTESFQTLGQQMIILEGEKNIKRVDLSNVRLASEGRVEFRITFPFSQEILK